MSTEDTCPHCQLTFEEGCDCISPRQLNSKLNMAEFTLVAPWHLSDRTGRFIGVYESAQLAADAAFNRELTEFTLQYQRYAK